MDMQFSCLAGSPSEQSVALMVLVECAVECVVRCERFQQREKCLGGRAVRFFERSEVYVGLCGLVTLLLRWQAVGFFRA